MSLEKNGEKCSVCQAYLFDDDDVVYCPECGAPHHRECYKSLGNCGYANFHGTPEQYSRAKVQQENSDKCDSIEEEKTPIGYVKCSMCGEIYSFEENECPKCDAPNLSKVSGGRFISFDFLGGVPAGMDIGGGVTADEAKRFVISNTHRYIPKFATFKAGKRASWNWVAFLAPAAWFLSRKMYAIGAVIAAVQVALSILSIPYINAFSGYEFENTQELLGIIQANFDSLKYAVIAALISSLVAFALNIICGVFGDIIYKRRVVSEITEIKDKNLDPEVEFRKRGGISMFACLIGFFAVQYLPTILFSFLKL